MSGGVDSAVAAARAVDAGHDVTGVHLALSRNPQSYRTGARGCCTLEDARDARRAADVIGIPFYVWDLAERFKPTWSTTSSPSTRPAGPPTRACAATRRSSSRRCWTGRWRSASTRSHRALRPARRDGALRRAVDVGKDQSYVLAVLTRTSSRTRCSRSATRPRRGPGGGAERGLLVADKPDTTTSASSPTATPTASWPGSSAARAGEIVDTDGAVLGSHEGAFGFTVGQRKGLRLDRPAPDGNPRYVLSIEPVATPSPSARPSALDVDRDHGDPAGLDRRARHRRRRSSARSSSARTARCTRARLAGGDELEISLRAPARGVATGQAAVLYDGDTVLGSATISAAR